MPHVSLKLYQGRSRNELEKISRNIQQCLVETVGWKTSDISVSIEEIEPDMFVYEVNKKIRDEEIIIPSDFIK